MLSLFCYLIPLISAIVLICLIRENEPVKEEKIDEENSDEEEIPKIIDLKDKNLFKSVMARALILLHIIILVFIGIGGSFELTVAFWISAIINIAVIVLCFMKSISKDKRIIIGIICVYIILMIALPIYKVREYEHYYNQTKVVLDENGSLVPNEEIREHIEYYDCYKLQLFRKK